MDIAKLGVDIDPNEAVRGADRVQRELKEIGDSAEKNLGKVDRESKKAGKGTEQMGRRAKRSFNDMASGALGVLDAFGLMNNGLGNMVRRAEGGTRGVTNLVAAHKQGRQAAVEQSGALDDMAGSAIGAKAGAKGLLRGLGPLIGILAAVAAAAIAAFAAFKLLQTGFRLIKAGIPKAAAIEDSTVAFAVLLGNADEARKRIGDLQQFAAKTPFQLPGLIEASRTLQVFTKGALATEEGLTLIGDAAAAAGRPISEVSMWVGRLYAALEGGQPVGEATMRLLEMGLITPKTKGALDSLAQSANKNGEAFDQLWSMARDELLKFTGTMALQSKTWNGLVSTLKDNWDQLLVALADPIKDALKPVLEDLIKLLQFLKPAAAAVGQAIGNSIKLVVQTIKDGTIMRALGLAIIAGIELGFNFMVKFFIFKTLLMGKALLSALVFGIKAAVAFFTTIFTQGVKLVSSVITGDWSDSTLKVNKGFGTAAGKVVKVIAIMIKNELGEAFDSVATAFQNAFFEVLRAIANGLNKILAKAQAVPGVGSKVKQLGIVATPKPVDFFQPEAGGSFADLNAALNDVLPSGNQDRFKDFAKDTLDKFNRDNPGPLDGELPKPAVDPTTDPTTELGDGAGAAGKKAKKAAEEALPPVVELAKEWGNLDKQLQNLAAGSIEAISFGFTDAIGSIIDGSKSAGQAFADLANQIVNDIIRMIIQLTIQASIMKALGFPVGGSLASFAQGIPALGGVAHGGSDGGDRGHLGMRVMHGGGVGSSERPTILDRNETVLTRRRSEELEMELAAARGGSQQAEQKQGGGVTIVNALDPQTIADAVAANPDLIVNAISRRKKQVKAQLQ